MLDAHTTALNFSSGPFSIKEAQFPISNNAIIGGYLNILTPRKSERISVHLEAFYSQEKHVGYLELNDPLTVHRNDYTIDVKRLSILSMERYTFETNGFFSPYLGIGLSHNVILSGKGVRRLESTTTINDTRYIETSISETYLYRRFYMAATAAVGTSYRFSDKHKALFQFRYEHGRYVSGTAIPGRTTHLKDHNSYYLTATYILN